MSHWLSAIDRGNQLALGAPRQHMTVWAGRLAGRYVVKAGSAYWSARVSRAAREELETHLAAIMADAALVPAWTLNRTAHDDPFESAVHRFSFLGVYREVDWVRRVDGRYQETVRVEHNQDPMGGAFIDTRERVLDPTAAAAAFDEEMRFPEHVCPFPRIEPRASSPRAP